jgi:hypothetical protein
MEYKTRAQKWEARKEMVTDLLLFLFVLFRL